MFRFEKHILSFLSCFLFVCLLSAQENLNKLDWDKVVYMQAEEWYGSDEAIRVAENVLLYQRNVGGWPKNKDMHLILSESEKRDLQKLQSHGIGATIDNQATVMEMDFLSKVYSGTKTESYKKAIQKGINYLLEAQYENGGWPQFYPLEKEDYSTHITYNDNAMVNVMNVLKAVSEKSDRFSFDFNEETIQQTKTAFNKGLEIILKTQYIQNGKLTAWCAQHDEKTLLPAQARAYELPSLSGSESVDIVLLLMQIENPSQEIIDAIQAAVLWFHKVKITGIKVEKFKNDDGVTDRRIINDKNAPPLWARFYDLKDNRPFFCDRDGIKKYSLAEIGHERRNGYGWYDDDPKEIFKKYKKWQVLWAPGKNVIEKH